MTDGLISEAVIAYQVVRRDLSASLIPGTLISFAALQTNPDWTAGDMVTTLACASIYFFLYIYTFCLSNQIVGYEEDCLNKPDRVLPSGRLTKRGALQRWAIACVAFPVVGFLFGGWSMASWALAWQVIFVFYNHLGLHRHWFTKNVAFITLGTIVQFAAGWELSAPLTDLAWRWILVIAISFGVTLHLQDLRDVPGDRTVGRRTLPIAIGELPTRWLLAIGIGLLPLVTHYGLIVTTQPNLMTLPFELALAALNLLVAVRVLRLRTPEADHKTYMLHTYWFCAVAGVGVVLL